MAQAADVGLAGVGAAVVVVGQAGQPIAGGAAAGRQRAVGVGLAALEAVVAAVGPREATAAQAVGVGLAGVALHRTRRRVAGRPQPAQPGAVVVDVGIHRDPATDAKGRNRLTGDVDFESVKHVASAITPVPGGVGPMTVAMVVLNTVIAAERQCATVRA